MYKPTTIVMRTDQHRELKKLASEQGKFLYELIEDIIDAYLEFAITKEVKDELNKIERRNHE